MFHGKNSSARLLVFSGMLSRCVTSFFFNLLNKNPSQLCIIESRSLRTSSVKYWRRKKKDDGPKMIKPGNCADVSKPLFEVACKNAVVIGGSDGFGYAAADHLLCMGANNLIIADVEPDAGFKAAQKLCDSYGKNRAHYIQYDIRNKCQAEAGLKAAFCKIKVIHIIFNDLDKERAPLKCTDSVKDNESNTARAIESGMQFLGKGKEGTGGVIINCASIFGFMGWPHDPYPIYCKKEPLIEVTKTLAIKHNTENTGVRLIALCPTKKQFSDIGLPDFPDSVPKKMDELPVCIPDTKYHIGTALKHVISWAKNGSAWVVEPAISIYQIPRLIHFPEKEGDKVDPQVYEAQLQTCPVKLDSRCADTSKACVPPKNQSCGAQKPFKRK